MKQIAILSLILSFTIELTGQMQPTIKKHATKDDSVLFAPILPKKSGFIRTFLHVPFNIDKKGIYLDNTNSIVICVEGHLKKGKREGIFTQYVYDSLDLKKRYKLAEQLYESNKLNGLSKTFDLSGRLIMQNNFAKDSLNGLSLFYYPDGITVWKEVLYNMGSQNFIERIFDKMGNLRSVTPNKNNVPNGQGRQYYPNGNLMDEVFLIDDVPNGIRTYYYPNGTKWFEQELKNGMPWNAISNFSSTGQLRDPGTLKDGNGTLIYYNEDNSVREVLTFKNGKEKNQ
jgi:antitoxin component YwqK of YwqJK toxin-antitoxin module